MAIFVRNTVSTPPKHCDVDTWSAQDVIQTLNLTANVEKGYYIETFADQAKINNRSYSTAIYYLLEGKVGPSYWHRVDAPEVWHHYAGALLRLDLSFDDGKPVDHRVLGKDIFHGQAPQVVINKMQWQRAESLGEWTLVGTTVAPGFTEGGFELAPPDWQPSGA
ncbi:cupin family protein [Clohesyomyces aquaticus]|uniref:Cupin family protein n=1 Tax=Clohesyomyces aquaticus TaxID=1231657 RepID=A0A1Y1YTA6_9PLEO|nr:cupin family protein [Clohesyomyces aquaticus]